MLNQLQRGDEPALLPCRRSGFLRRPQIGVQIGDRLLDRPCLSIDHMLGRRDSRSEF